MFAFAKVSVFVLLFEYGGEGDDVDHVFRRSMYSNGIREDKNDLPSSRHGVRIGSFRIVRGRILIIVLWFIRALLILESDATNFWGRRHQSQIAVILIGHFSRWQKIRKSFPEHRGIFNSISTKRASRNLLCSFENENNLNLSDYYSLLLQANSIGYSLGKSFVIDFTSKRTNQLEISAYAPKGDCSSVRHSSPKIPTTVKILAAVILVRSEVKRSLDALEENLSMFRSMH